MSVELTHLGPLSLPGIAPEVVAERGYRFLDADEAASELPALGFADYQAALGSGLLVPMYGALGADGHYQFRPDTPRTKADGKALKYETPEGAHNILDVHPRMQTHLTNPTVTFVITEGVKKADALTSLGVLAGALAGVWSWRTKDASGETRPLPELDAIPWQERNVVLVWDSDTMTNSDVMHALRALAEDLTGRGAHVTALIPPSADGAKVGVDDYLAAGGVWGELLPLALDNLTPLVSHAGFVAGDDFFLEVPDGIACLWGSGVSVLWAWGEPFLIGALQGLGKTSDALQLAFGLMGVTGFEEFYGYPITPLPEGKTVVYAALDRPVQIARAGARLLKPLGQEERDKVRERFRPYKGSLPFDIAKEPEKLLPWLLAQDAGVFIIDSLKDVLAKLSDEEGAAMVMRAIQSCIAAGIQVLILHHIRKPNALNKKPKTLADLHGSDNITRGCGSVITLWAPAAGATEVELNHVKPPAEPVGPFVIHRDHMTGRSTRERTGVIASDAKAQRKVAILAHYREAGGVGVSRTWEQLTAAGLGSTNSLRPVMIELQAEGWLTPEGVTEGGAGNEVQWVMRDRSADVV